MLRQLLALAAIDFRSRYAGHSLGVLWAFLYPAAIALLYFFVFGVILKTGPVDGSPYLVWLLSALAPFLFVSEAASSASCALIDYSYLARKSRLNIALLPAARVLSCFPVHAVFLAVLLVLGGGARVSLLGYIVAELLFSLAVGYFLSVITVFFRDLKSLLPIITQLGFWVTPIFWDIGAAPDRIRVILRLINPVIYISEGFRAAVGAAGPCSGWYAAYFWIFTSVLLALSIGLFFGIHSRIVDHL